MKNELTRPKGHAPTRDPWAHPDGSAHSESGPLGCFACANVRRGLAGAVDALADALRAPPLVEPTPAHTRGDCEEVAVLPVATALRIHEAGRVLEVTREGSRMLDTPPAPATSTSSAAPTEPPTPAAPPGSPGWRHGLYWCGAGRCLGHYSEERCVPPAPVSVPEAPATQPRAVDELEASATRAAETLERLLPEGEADDVGALKPQDLLDMAHVLETFSKCVNRTPVTSLGGEYETGVRLGELEHMLSEASIRARILGRATMAMSEGAPAVKLPSTLPGAPPRRPTMTSILAEHQEKRDAARLELLALLAKQTPGVARSRRWISLEVDTKVMRELRGAVRDGLVKARRASRSFGMAYEITAEGRALLGGAS